MIRETNLEFQNIQVDIDLNPPKGGIINELEGFIEKNLSKKELQNVTSKW